MKINKTETFGKKGEPDKKPQEARATRVNPGAPHFGKAAPDATTEEKKTEADKKKTTPSHEQLNPQV